MSASSIERPSSPVLPRLGRYEVLGELASGGTGTVYLTRLHGPGGFERLFAIKVLHKHYAARAEVVELLLREAHLAAQVHHPHVVDIVEIGMNDEGQYYLVMGYVEGASLDDLLAHPKLDAIRRVRLGLPILLDAMSGLDAAHRAKDATTGEPLGIVHRDVSPANILVGLDGIGRIADFGIASARAHSSISEPGIVRGTPRYMAPEQASGEVPIDARADVFALGAVLWEIITGEPLFDSQTSVEHILRQVVSATIPPPSDRNSRMPEELDAICLRALARDRNERYASVSELRDALARVADGAGLIASNRELIDELGALFESRVAQRRSLVSRAGRSSTPHAHVRETRRSGTQLRAILIAGDPSDKRADAEFGDEETTVFERTPAPALDRRSSITETQIGLSPAPDSKPDAQAATLEELLGRAEEDEDDKVELAFSPTETQRIAVPKRRWRRWVGLALLASAVFGGALSMFGHRSPEAQRPAAQPEPARAPAPAAAPRGIASALILDVPPEAELPAPASEPDPVSARAKQASSVARPRAAPPRPAAQPPRPSSRLDPAPESEPAELTLPLETNPYRLQR